MRKTFSHGFNKELGGGEVVKESDNNNNNNQFRMSMNSFFKTNRTVASSNESFRSIQNAINQSVYNENENQFSDLTTSNNQEVMAGTPFKILRKRGKEKK